MAGGVVAKTNSLNPLPLELADLLRARWPGYARANRSRLASSHDKAVRSVLACRTAELGGNLYQCGGCKNNHFAYHSFNHRNCPRCGSAEQEEWTARQEAQLLPAPYFLVTFTIPKERYSLGLAYPKEFYHLMMKESFTALREVAATKLKRPHLRLDITSDTTRWDASNFVGPAAPLEKNPPFSSP